MVGRCLRACVWMLAFAFLPAQAAERLAVLELQGKAMSADERALLSDEVRGAVVRAAGQGIQVMTRENMEVMLTDMGIDASCVAEGACEVETARNLGVDYVVSGAVVLIGTTQVASLKLHRTENGQLLSSERAQGEGTLALLEAIDPVASKLVAPVANAAPNAAKGNAGAGAPSPQVAASVGQPLLALPEGSGDSAYDQMAEQKRLESLRRLKELLATGVKGETKAEMMLRTADLYYQQGVHLMRSGGGGGADWLGKAVKLYDAISRDHTGYQRMDQVRFFRGMSAAYLGDKAMAVSNLQVVVSQYPQSSYVSDAKGALANLEPPRVINP